MVSVFCCSQPIIMLLLLQMGSLVRGNVVQNKMMMDKTSVISVSRCDYKGTLSLHGKGPRASACHQAASTSHCWRQSSGLCCTPSSDDRARTASMRKRPCLIVICSLHPDTHSHSVPGSREQPLRWPGENTNIRRLGHSVHLNTESFLPHKPFRGHSHGHKFTLCPFSGSLSPNSITTFSI